MADDDGPKLTAAGDLPGPDENGFYDLLDKLRAGAHSRQRYVTVTVWEAGGTKINHRKANAHSYSLAVVSVEVLTDDADADQALAMHDRSQRERTGTLVGAGEGGQPHETGGKDKE